MITRTRQELPWLGVVTRVSAQKHEDIAVSPSKLVRKRKQAFLDLNDSEDKEESPNKKQATAGSMYFVDFFIFNDS